MDLDKFLQEHETWTTPKGNLATDRRWFCSCGDQVDDDYSGVNIVARHRAHVVRKLADHIADVWDEAVQALAWALDQPNTSPINALDYVRHHNPYREGAVK